MMLRPIQIRANAEDAAFMIGQAEASSERHHELSLPVAIFAGAEDLVIDPTEHAVRLHAEVPQGPLTVVPGAGHMVHYAAADEIVAAIDRRPSNESTSLGGLRSTSPRAAHHVPVEGVAAEAAP